MPGRLLMDHHAAIESQDLKKDRSKAQGDSLSQKRDFAQMQAASHANETGNHVANGPLLNGHAKQAPAINGSSVDGHAVTGGLPTPPTLDQSWRDSDANKPMGVMVDRLAQQCFSDLNETLTKMSETPTSQTGQTNGILPQTYDASETSLSRKRALMQFAHDQRDRFIKTLVLSDWARNAADMARLVDIKVWQEAQSAAQLRAIQFIGITKSDMVRAKMPNPNIEGAMELLSTGKAPNWPDLGYLPPKKLTAKQLLKTLRGMNVTLATRLNLHEDLPAHFNNFSIANGRATFHVPSEFEVDLSVADEDVTTPFYFIDMRFSFSPAPNLLDHGLRAAIESRANAALATKGLEGCYEFLHNLVLTHKINALRAQARQLFHEKWFDCLWFNTHRRVLALQYWKGRPGKKSWIEIGVSTGKSKNKNSRQPPKSRHSVRWFRRGVEVHDDSIEIDWQTLNLDSVLSTVVAKHSTWALRQIRDELQQHAPADSKLETQLNSSATDPEDCSLTLSLSGLRTPVTLRFAPITGKLSISPPTRNAAHIERFLDTNPGATAAPSLAELLCRTVQERISQATNLAGWRALDQNNMILHPSVKALRDPAILRRSMYICNKGWGSHWALCITYSLLGEKWWVVGLEEGVEQEKPVKVIATAQELLVARQLLAQSGTTRRSMLQIEHAAQAEVSFAVLTRELASTDIQYRIDRLTPLTELTDGSIKSNWQALAIYLRSVPSNRKELRRVQRSDLSLADWIRITHHGVVREDMSLAEIRHEIRLNIDPSKLKNLKAYLTDVNPKTSDIAMNSSGALALKLRTPFGQPFIDRVESLLQKCKQLDHYLAGSKNMGYSCTSLSLSDFAFSYGSFGARLLFSNTQPIRLKLEPANMNPHHRIRTFLQTMINNTNSQDPFFHLAMTMKVTLPWMQILDQLEAAHLSRRSLNIHVRSSTTYVLTFSSPLPACQFQVKIFAKNKDRASNKKEYWYSVRFDESASKDVPDGFMAALEEFSRTDKSHNWVGDNKRGFISNVNSLHDALQKLEEILRKFESAPGAVDVKKQETLAVQAVKPTGQQLPTPAPASGPQKPLPAPMQQQKPKPNGNLNKQARPSPASGQNHGHASGAKNEVIELD